MELLAEKWLRQQGLRTVERNFTCRVGELDLVMLEQDTLVFVEVRYRRSQGFGGAAASITPKKQQRIIRAAQVFLQQHQHYSTHPMRFDVMALDGDKSDPKINWISGAFCA